MCILMEFDCMISLILILYYVYPLVDAVLQSVLAQSRER